MAKAPRLNAPSFDCPHCRALAHQNWYVPAVRPLLNIIEAEQHELVISKSKVSGGESDLLRKLLGLHISQCFSCNRLSVWVEGKLVYPSTQVTYLPHPDMPADVKKDFDEASAIVAFSPRAACALLRLSIQRLCIHLKQPGKNLRDDIGNLAAAGLAEDVIRALDIVRIVGNHAVHPGEILVDEDASIAPALFKLVNLIVEQCIARKREIEELFSMLPAGAREDIVRRDERTKADARRPSKA